MPYMRLRETVLNDLKTLKSYPYEPLGGVLSRLIEFFKKHNPEK